MPGQKGKHSEAKTKKAPAKGKAAKTQASSEKQTNKKSSGGKNAVLIIALVLVLIAAAAVAGGVLVGKTDTIHPNVTLGGVSIGGMSVEQAAAALDKGGWSADDGSAVTVKLPAEYSFTVTAKDAGLSKNSAEAAQAAYAYGHSGDIFSDLAAYFKCCAGKAEETEIFSKVNEKALRAKIGEALSELDDILDTGYTTDLEAAELKLIKGADKVVINGEEIYGMVLDAFTQGKSEIAYELKVEDSPEPVDFEKIHDEIFAEAVSAEYDPETQKATASTVGVDFDASDALKVWEAAEVGELVKIELTVTQPKYTTEQLDEMLFADVLGEQTTAYRTSGENRVTNVQLAADKINGVILNPGEEFSYNDVVGKRTKEAGFKPAGAYAGGQVVQEYGGGICQVSSTLYCACLYANLKITARDNHCFAVGYVPDGLDATVSWGGPEYKFVNDRDLPIKIVCTYTSDKTITVQILGTDIDGSYVKMETSSGYRYHSEYPEVAIGTYTYSYRCVYDKDGNLLSRTKEAYSVYNYHEENIKLPEPSPSVEPTPDPTPSDSASLDEKYPDGEYELPEPEVTEPGAV